jgi:hypothetical protein
MNKLLLLSSLIFGVVIGGLDSAFADGSFTSAGGGGSSAGKGTYPSGTQVEAGVGYGYSGITNPDSTTAYYQTLSIFARGHVVLLGDSSSFSALDLTGGAAYYDLKNSSTAVNNEKEVGNIIGPTIGLHGRIHRVVVGYQFEYLLGRNYSIGPISHEMDYQMTANRVYAGLQYNLGQLALSLTYTTSMATLPQSSTGLSVSSPYTDNIIYLNFTYSLGVPFVTFLKELF